MITFTLKEHSSSEHFVQIKQSEIISAEYEVFTDYHSYYDETCHCAKVLYVLSNGKALEVVIVSQLVDYKFNRETAEWDIPYEVPREDFIKFLKDSKNFDVTFIKWSK